MDVDGDAALQALTALSLEERRLAVVKDVHRRVSLFSAIPAHDLADALGVPEHWEPGDEWTFVRYAEMVSVEEYARDNSPASELVYLIQDTVSVMRFQELLQHSESLDDADDPSFAFLTSRERTHIEQAIAESQLEANEANGMNCLARCSVATDSGGILEFEGDIEDDGSCINLRTPYDKKAKRFTDLSRYATPEE